MSAEKKIAVQNQENIAILSGELKRYAGKVMHECQLAKSIKKIGLL